MSSRSPALSSESRAQIAHEANGNFLRMRYRWPHESVEQEDCLLFGNQNASDAITAAWCDCFHVSGATHAQGHWIQCLRSPIRNFESIVATAPPVVYWRASGSVLREQIVASRAQ